MTQPDPAFTLEITHPGQPNLQFQGAGECEIGRSPSNLLCLPGDGVSRRHALIRRTAAGYVLIDLGSSNGTAVNGARITAPVALHHGDTIELGPYTLTFRSSSAVPAPRAPSPETALPTRLHFDVKLSSVLVIDLRGFTTMGRSMNADTLSRLTAAWVRPSSEIFYKRGALMCKPIGDAIMAVWTHATPTADPHRLREILHAIADLPRVFHQVTADFQLPAPLRFGAGVSTGEVSLTTLGSGRADVLGDTVNLAFRLETASKATGADILLCDASLQALRQQWPMSEFEPHAVALKGYPEPVTAWGSRLP